MSRMRVSWISLRNCRLRDRQCRNRLIRFCKVECAREITDGGTTPRAQVGNFGAKTRLEKPQQGGVIEEARGYKPAPAERRDHKHRHTETQADGSKNLRRANHRRIRDCGRSDVFACRARRRRHWRDVVEKSAILVIRDKQRRLRPLHWIRTQSGDY